MLGSALAPFAWCPSESILTRSVTTGLASTLSASNNAPAKRMGASPTAILFRFEVSEVKVKRSPFRFQSLRFAFGKSRCRHSPKGSRLQRWPPRQRFLQVSWSPQKTVLRVLQLNRTTDRPPSARSRSSFLYHPQFGNRIIVHAPSCALMQIDFP